MPRSHGSAAGPAEAPIIAGFAGPLDSGAAPPGRSDAALSDLIGDVYDAALDDGLWPGVLHKAAAFVGGCAASVYSKDSVHRTAEITHGVGIDDAFKRSYLDGYVKIDPTTPGFFFCGVGEVVNTPDILPYDEFLQSRFYAEWVAPQGLVDQVTTVLEKSATSYAVFSVFRHARDGLADEGARHRMRLLAPHVRRAVQIGRTVTLGRAEAATFADTLDSLVAATFLVDATGRIVHANRAGHAMVAEGTVMRAARGRLLAADGESDRLLQGTLAAAAAAAAAAAGDGGEGGASLPLPGPDDRHHVAHVLPLTAGARRRAGAGYAATAAVFVCRARIEPPAAPEAIARLYGLTPSELKVLLAVFEAGGVADLAATLGISETTAKTHLRRLFEKTGTRRQADLVKLVAGFAPPGR
ncbi:DNA-binding CsgD family transcriptional regulator/PAS domain-containing protein [Rhodoplanes tepidamans]|uniref:Helix-turn-helix transcriptional regulator n=1 Tax=Rhodoplanes tepidamans TaxID=200616 RepID=A0ABT5JBH8_RHOTP|nr:helix-turn-helix transcriptional regulator [Rhodoplanes tepidamans]MDC7786798.1 helix-turn-helix transcriptional regulator [Rhodoplanes tepidamans]MDQ0355925.1 DNA-binding CsgD family transcriptional regulator/PAS domain-containing protein [Rhodoplanes tepidamans]